MKVVLCWHMHQPHYFDNETGQYQLPWTYLHAIKDYVDMVAVIEETPGARAVVNFAPTLLEQLDDYAEQVAAHLDQGHALKDPLLAALTTAAPPTDSAERLHLIRACLKANEKHLIHRFPAFAELAHMARWVLARPEMVSYLDEQFFTDLVTWYHLAWMGETVRHKEPRLKALLLHARHFNAHQRRQLLEVIGELLAGVIARYRRLADAGRIELSVTPYAHPIVPLLLDLKSAREATPLAPLPHLPAYPGGEERARWHIDHGLKVFESHFGFRPRGCWPSEGAVSDATLRLLDESGFAWAATGEGVLRSSLERAGFDLGCIHRPYRLDGGELTCFFRDDGLSDLIGFTYADWHADDAVNNFIHHLENIAAACAHEPSRVVPVILDGENAWEYYPENGYHFLTGLYRRLVEHPGIELTTFTDVVDSGVKATRLPHVVAGSWVYGSFSTWIGDAEKNRGWELLGHAKAAFDRAVAGGLAGEALAAAERQLAICEGSDWFWWFGDYNPAESVRDFDRLYRLQLAELYRLLHQEPPDEIEHVISHGGGAPETGGVMRRGREEHGTP